MGGVTYPTLEHVAMEARVYPERVLERAETGLVLFAAAWLGHNDAIHFARHDVSTVCVDTDEERLEQMRELYPDGWDFVAMDAFTYARAARDLGLTWDVVSLDPFTGEAMERARAELELWTSIANRAVVLGVSNEVPDAMIPRGWESAGYVPRSSIAEWYVLERA